MNPEPGYPSVAESTHPAASGTMSGMTPDDLGPAELAVWRAFPRGERVDLRSAEEHTVRGEVLRLLVLGAHPDEPGHLPQLWLIGAHVTGALDLAYADIRFPVRLESCVFDKQLEFYGARTRQLSLSGSQFPGLGGSTAVVDGNLRLNNCLSTGQIRLVGTRVTGTVMLSGAHLGGHATPFSATRLVVGNDILGTEGLVCEGELKLNNAEVAGAVRLEGAQLRNPGGIALSAVDITVGAIVNCCEGFAATGKVTFSYSTIHSRLCFQRARLANPSDRALSCRHVETPELVLQPSAPIDGVVDLRHARIGLLRDDPATWPATVQLDGLRYEALENPAGAARLRWIRLDPQGYLPQAYEQLADEYRRRGNEAEARTVLRAKQRHRTESLSPIGRFWGYLQDATVGYGYRPSRAVAWLFALLAIGTVLFGLNPPAPFAGTDPPDFNAFVYTLDLLVPIVDFGQRHAFNPHGAMAWLAYGLIAAGWVLATTVAAGATRALRRD